LNSSMPNSVMAILMGRVLGKRLILGQEMKASGDAPEVKRSALCHPILSQQSLLSLHGYLLTSACQFATRTRRPRS